MGDTVKKKYPIIIGLTGSIGMGKSTVARLFKRLGAAVLDSDKVVHNLLAEGGAAVEKVAAIFPSTRKGNAIDRAILGHIVFHDSFKMKQLEAILHPLVRKEQNIFIQKARKKKMRFVVLDIPLLFETQAQKRCDYVVVADAPPFIQRRRVLTRVRMTEEKFLAILARQMPASKKRRKADVIIPTGGGLHNSFTVIKKFIRMI